jgi:A/G-specific adenine glycosylase
MGTTSGSDAFLPPVTQRQTARVRALGMAIDEWGSTGVGTTRRDDLPWRSTRDPWAVLVSETLAQQTQLSRVVPAYHRFLELFPDPPACASAPLGDVLIAWEGMGYNRRARNLHRAASIVVAEHGGAVPDDLDALLALPGVGPYTARAVLAFAFERDVGVIDTNAGRILSRAASGSRLMPAAAQALVDVMVPAGRGWSFGQALLDLGASVCTARAPDCPACPLRCRCAWSRAGRPDPDPASGSAGVSVAQSRFAGSDRQGRGRLVAALRRGPLPADALAAAAGWPDDTDRADRIADGLVSEGLIVRNGTGTMRLP